MTSYSMRPVSSYNEVTHHALDVIFTQLQLKKGPLKVDAGQAMSANNFGQAISGAASGFVTSTLQGMQKLVNDEFAADEDSEVGLSVAQVYDRLKRKRVADGLTMEQMREICNSLVGEGHMYRFVWFRTGARVR